MELAHKLMKDEKTNHKQKKRKREEKRNKIKLQENRSRRRASLSSVKIKQKQKKTVSDDYNQAKAILRPNRPNKNSKILVQIIM